MSWSFPLVRDINLRDKKVFFFGVNAEWMIERERLSDKEKPFLRVKQFTN